MTNTRFNGINLQDRAREKISGGRDHKIWDCESPLYDSYELVSFAHVIERKLIPLSPLCIDRRDLSPPSGLSLRALMDKDKDDFSFVSKMTMPSTRRRKDWWNWNKNDGKKENIKKKKKMFDCNFWWNSCYKNLFV